MAVHERHISDDTGMTDSGAALHVTADLVIGWRVLANSLAEPDAKLEDFRTLAGLLHDIQYKRLAPAQAAVVIEQKTPFAAIARILPDTKADYYQFISMLATVVGMSWPTCRLRTSSRRRSPHSRSRRLSSA